MIKRFLSTAVAPAGKRVKQRSEIADQYKWRLGDIYRSDEDWHQDLAKLKEMMPQLSGFAGKLSESGTTLFKLLDLKDQLAILYSKLQIYAYLKLDEDNRESRYQAMLDEIAALGTGFAEAAAYIAPEIMAISDQRMSGLRQEHDGLKVYDHYLDDLRRKRAHILPPEQERLMALSGNVSRGASQIFRMVDDADLKFGTVVDDDGEEVVLTKQRYYDLLESSKREVRKNTLETMMNGYLTYINTLGATLSTSVYTDLFHARAREYGTCLEASLDANNIPVRTYQNLIDTVNANLEALHRWASLRRRVLGYDKLHPYDIFVPLVPKAKMKVSYDKAVEHIVAGLRPLGDGYLEDLKMGLSSGWIDVYETEGKGSGAYSFSTYATHPYILMNYNDTLDNMFTLAHELGHALHSHYSKQHQPFIYSGHAIFTAEVASTTNEELLMHHMLDHSENDDQRAYLLNYYIQQIVGTFFTQAMYSEFEGRIHEDVETGRPLTADAFRKHFRDIYQKYWGPEMELLENSDIGCLRIPHFYRSFYVYQYATSYSASTMISQKILGGDQPARDSYLGFLKAGESKYPIDILKDTGVDLTTPEPIEATIKLFVSLVDELEKLLVK